MAQLALEYLSVTCYCKAYMPEIRSFPVLHSANYQLRQIVAADMSAIFQGLSDPRVSDYYGVSYDTLASTQAQLDWYEEVWQAGTGIWWGISSKEAPDHLLGTCGLHEWEQEHHCAETGFWLSPDHWGKAVIPECLSVMIAHCFQHLGLHRLQAMVEPENIASWRLLEKLGFRLEGVLRECEYKHARYVDLKCYSMLATEFRSGQD
ncbi:GNAT family N-acetyltransferase [Undibacterium sp. Ji50W]|uniref:GNAT family N-acetyltransferase n=1 Tax=Undibacterium sp. Ji50W TaxID=3413041 RepID=UPI003BF45C27